VEAPARAAKATEPDLFAAAVQDLFREPEAEPTANPAKTAKRRQKA
jgi:hypothetical protein